MRFFHGSPEEKDNNGWCYLKAAERAFRDGLKLDCLFLELLAWVLPGHINAISGYSSSINHVTDGCATKVSISVFSVGQPWEAEPDQMGFILSLV